MPSKRSIFNIINFLEDRIRNNERVRKIDYLFFSAYFLRLK